MLTSKMVKELAVKAGFDLAGVANIERFDDAPPEMHPCTIFPETKSVVVMATRILRGSYRGVAEGTEWSTYWIFGYGAGIYGILNEATRQVQSYIESFGWEAVQAPGSATLPEMGPLREPVAPGKLASDVTVSFRLAAAAAGLGELGHAKVFLTPQFGPRQRFAVVLTDAKLEPDPLFEGTLCDDCRKCVSACPGGAIGKSRTVSTEIDGRKFKWAPLDYGKCKLTHWGFNKAASPFVARDLPGLVLPIGSQRMKWREAYDFGWTLANRVGYIQVVSRGITEIEQPGRPGSICAARGCIQACDACLSASGVIPGKRSATRASRRAN